jgi:ABC-type uncharacterized transport system substrate-binding protein
VVLALGGDVTPAVVSATQTIPIVFSSSADPVQLGFVASLGLAASWAGWLATVSATMAH